MESKRKNTENVGFLDYDKELFKWVWAFLVSDSCLEISAIFQNPLTFVFFISAFDNDMLIAPGFLLPSRAYCSPLFAVGEKMSEF